MRRALAGVPWPRSVRGRLAATYTLAALLLALVGGLLFASQLHRGLVASLDASLAASSLPLTQALTRPGEADVDALAPGPGAAASGLQSVSVVFRPDGSIAASSPSLAPPTLVPSDALGRGRLGVTRTTSVVNGESIRLQLNPVARADGVWVVAVGASLRTVREASDRVDAALLLSAPPLLGVVGVGAWLLSGAALRPVDRMRAEAADLGEHDPAGRISTPGTGDELAALAVTFNGLLDRLHRSAARQRDLVADAGHELRTPLAVLRVELELADRPDRSRAELADAVGHARGEVERLSRLAEDLLFLARADGGQPLVQRESLDLAALLTDVCRASRATAATLGITLRLHAPAALATLGDPSALRRAVDNLVSNALSATPAGGFVEVSVRREAGIGSGAPGLVAVEVRDNGPGFPVAFLPDALQRFRRADSSRAAGGGSGLGLAIAAEILAAHEGSVCVANHVDGGAVVTLLMPDTLPPQVLSPSLHPLERSA